MRGYSIPLMITKIEPSPLKHKRFRATLDNGLHADFGLRGGQTYIDHQDASLRAAYQKRHLGNTIERRLIENIIFSPATLSYYLLWGPHTTISANIATLNRMWAEKKSRK